MCYRKRRKILCAVFCVTALMLCGCGEKEPDEKQLHRSSQTFTYEESDFAALPTDEIVTPEGMLTVSTLQRDRENRPAMYIPEEGLDEGDYYQRITGYSLNKDGSWESKEIDRKSLTKRVRKVDVDWLYSIPYVLRGDDGELYALLQLVPADSGELEKKTSVKYSVLHLDEEKDAFSEIPLRLDDVSLEKVTITPDILSQFHVLEDGTFFFVFGKRTAIQFDAQTGAPNAVCETVPGNAFAQNVGFGNREFVFYSSSDKLLGVLDLDTMTVGKSFGEDVEENYRKRVWFFDTHSDDWSMFAFNTSGLYTILRRGKTTAIERISKEHSFDSLEDVTIYDVLVDEGKNVYVLLRKKMEGSYDYQSSWEFGVARFSCSE